jgi:hypothetical protein
LTRTVDHDHDHDLKTFNNAYAVHQENDSKDLATIYDVATIYFIWFTG